MVVTVSVVEDEHSMKDGQSPTTIARPVESRHHPVTAAPPLVIGHASISSGRDSSLPLTSNRPCVSILKPIRHVHVAGAANDTKGTIEIMSDVASIRSADPLSPTSSATTHNLTHKLQQPQVSKGASCLGDSQESASDVIIATASSVSNSQPLVVTHSRAALLKQATKPTTSNIPTFHVTSSKAHASLTHLLADEPNQTIVTNEHNATNDCQAKILSPNSKLHRIVQELKVARSEASRESKAMLHSNSVTVNNLHSYSLPSDALLSDSRSLSRDNGAHAQTVTLIDVPRPNATPVIVTQRSSFSSHSSSATQLGHVTIRHPPLPHLTSGGSAKPTAAQTHIQAHLSNASNSKNVYSISTSVGRSHLSNIQFHQSKHVSVRQAEDVDAHLPGAVLRVDGPPTQVYSLSEANVAQSLVNGIHDEGGETESVSHVSALSPDSIASSCATLEVDTVCGESEPSTASLVSPNQQRKSGRVRTLKSPDPDYITPSTKGTLRGCILCCVVACSRVLVSLSAE